MSAGGADNGVGGIDSAHLHAPEGHATALFREAYAVAKATGQAVRVLSDVMPTGEVLVVETAAHGRRRETSEPPRLSDALARARQRGERRAADLLDDPDMMTSDAMAEALGVSRETVNRMRHRGELLGLEGARRGVRYPAWQLMPPERLPMPEMSELFRVFGEPWSVFRFLLQAHPELHGPEMGNMRGLDAILLGRSTAAVELARTIAAGTIS